MLESSRRRLTVWRSCTTKHKRQLFAFETIQSKSKYAPSHAKSVSALIGQKIIGAAMDVQRVATEHQAVAEFAFSDCR